MYFLAMYYESVCEVVICLEPTMTVISEEQPRKTGMGKSTQLDQECLQNTSFTHR